MNRLIKYQFCSIKKFNHIPLTKNFNHLSLARFSTQCIKFSNNNAEEDISENEQQEEYLTDEEIIKSIPDFRPPYFHEILEKAVTEGKSIKDMTPVEEQAFMDNIKRRILMYCRNRGRVETELFLGGFARENVPKMTQWSDLEEFYDLLCEHDSDLYNWLIATETDRQDPEWKEKLPERWRDSDIMERLFNYVDSKRAVKYYETNEQVRAAPTTSNKGNATFNEDYDQTDSGEFVKQ